MNTTSAYGLLLALVNGLICISIPMLVSYTQRKLKQSQDDLEPVALSQVELLSSESN